MGGESPQPERKNEERNTRAQLVKSQLEGNPPPVGGGGKKTRGHTSREKKDARQNIGKKKQEKNKNEKQGRGGEKSESTITGNTVSKARVEKKKKIQPKKKRRKRREELKGKKFGEMHVENQKDTRKPPEKKKCKPKNLRFNEPSWGSLGQHSFCWPASPSKGGHKGHPTRWVPQPKNG